MLFGFKEINVQPGNWRFISFFLDRVIAALIVVVSSFQESDAAKHEEENEILHINVKSAVVFVITASTFLLLLYFFMSAWFVWVLIVLFCIGGVEVHTIFNYLFL